MSRINTSIHQSLRLCAISLVTAALLGCNPRAIPTVIFPAKPEPAPEPAATAPAAEPPAPAAPQTISKTITIRLTADTNPDRAGQPSPLQVRVFLHSDAATIESASFEELFEFGNRTAISQPLFVRIIQPGSQLSFDIDIQPQHKVLAVAAAYREIGKAKWLQTVAVDRLADDSQEFVLSQYSVDMTDQ